jgi:hypothetical protein
MYNQLKIFSVMVTLSLLCSCALWKKGDGVFSQQSTAVWEANGIKVDRVTLSAAGMLVDLRYHITNLELAKKVITRPTDMALIDQKSGNILLIPNAARTGKVQQFHLTDDKKREYWVLFSNTGQLIKSGSKVTFSIGSLQIKDITVD